MPQGDDFITNSDQTPDPMPVDPTAAPVPDGASDDAAPAPADETMPGPMPPAETPEQAAQKRADRAFAAQRRTIDAQNARIAALEARINAPGGLAPAPSESTPSQPTAGAPQPESYATHAEYVQATAQWAVEQYERDQEAVAAANAIQTGWEQQETQARSKYTDYDEALQADATLYHPALCQAIQTSDQGTDLAYHLATHPEDATRIATLARTNVAGALRALGQLEAQIATPAPPSTPTPGTPSTALTPAQSSLPRPLEPVGVAGAPGASASPDQLSHEDFRAWWKKTYGHQ